MDNNGYQMNHLTNHNYIGSLQELCVKLKMTESSRSFTELGPTMCINNRNLFKMQAKVLYDQKEFVGIGEGYKKQEAKSISAKFCLIRFVAHLRANDHPQLCLEDYGLTEDDLVLGTDPKLYVADDSGLNSSLSSSSSESSEKRAANKSKPVEHCPAPNRANDPLNSLASIQSYVNNRETYKKEVNPFGARKPSKAADSSTSDTPQTSAAALYAKPPNTQVPFSRTNRNESPTQTIDLEFSSSISLNDEDEDEEDERRVLQLNDFKTKNSRSDIDRLSQTDQSEGGELATNSPSNQRSRADDTVNGLDYILDNQPLINYLFDGYDLQKGLTYHALLCKLLDQLPKLSGEFRQNKLSSNGKISYQKLYYGDWNLVTVFSDAPAAESAEDCSLKIFLSLRNFKLS